MTVCERLFILRIIRHGEADLIIHALTPCGAKVGLFARSALRSRKRFGGGVLEPTHYIEALYTPPHHKDGESRLGTLKEAKLLESFSGVRQDYDRLQMAFYFLEVISRISHDGTLDGKDIFNLLGNTLKGLEVAEDLEKLKTHFEIKALNYQGILPFYKHNDAFLCLSTKESDQIFIPMQDWGELKKKVHDALCEYIAPFGAKPLMIK